MNRIHVVENVGDAEIAGWLAQRIGAKLVDREGPVTITVPGGSTPFPIIARLLEHDLDWSRLVVWPNDDRQVPPDHEASNTDKLRTLFDRVGAEVVTLTTMEQVPPFDLAWLGMGADGHIASLFPNTDPQVDAAEPIVRLTPEPLPPEAPFDRISLTLPSLLASEEIVFVIRGADKRAVFDAAASGETDLPVARLLGAARQDVTCFA